MWSRNTAVLSALAAASLIICLPTLRALVASWRALDYSGHVLVMLVIAVAIAKRNLEAIRRAYQEASPPRAGFVAVLAAAVFQVLMRTGDLGLLAGLSVPLLMLAIAYALGGSALLRPLQGPLLCLALTVPPGFLLNQLHPHLKGLIAKLAVRVLQMRGVPVSAAGFHINLPGERLVVTDACAGVAAMFGLFALVWAATWGARRRFMLRIAALPLIAAFVVGCNALRSLVAVALLPSLPVHEVQAFLAMDLSIPTVALGGAILWAGFFRHRMSSRPLSRAQDRWTRRRNRVGGSRR